MGNAILKTYPGLESAVGKRLEDWTVGMRKRDRDCDVYLDFQIGINTPLSTTGSVRGLHVDSNDELIGGLLYMRDLDDESTGGELEIYRIDNPTFTGKNEISNTNEASFIRRIPYSRNSGALFLNSPTAAHAVSPRTPSPLPRNLISICADMPRMLFRTTR